MLHFRNFNFPKLLVDNLKLPKTRKVKMSHQFKSEMAKGEVYKVLVVAFLKWTIVTSKNGKVDKQNGTEG